jgi:hypothetical protein
MLQTCRTQLRPVMMTCIVACVGLIPAAFSTGIGSQVQRPLALVVVGGMLLAPVLILLVLPVLIMKFSKARELPPEDAREAAVMNHGPSRWFLLCGAALCACVGPNFHRPAPPATDATPPRPLPAATASADTPGGAAQQFLAGKTCREIGGRCSARRISMRWSKRRCAPIPAWPRRRPRCARRRRIRPRSAAPIFPSCRRFLRCEP